MKLATVILRHKRKKGRYMEVNQRDYAGDLGTAKYRDYELVRERHNEDEEATATLVGAEDTVVDEVAEVSDGDIEVGTEEESFGEVELEA